MPAMPAMPAISAISVIRFFGFIPEQLIELNDDKSRLSGGSLRFITLDIKQKQITIKTFETVLS